MTTTDSSSTLSAAILVSLDSLLAALDLEPLGGDRFAGISERSMFGRIYGGQLLAQTVVAASATVDDKRLHSLHAYFIRAGNSDDELVIEVERLRDGRTMATRQVNILQEGRLLFSAMASFHQSQSDAHLATGLVDVAGPEQTPPIQHWAGRAPSRSRSAASRWIDVPPPLDFRIDTAPRFMAGPGCSEGAHWIRLPRPVADDAVLHSALLAHASDYLLMDKIFGCYPGLSAEALISGLSLDHSLWFHRPVRLEEWHLYSQTAWAVSGERGLARGDIHDRQGRLVASVTQEVLVMSPV